MLQALRVRTTSQSARDLRRPRVPARIGQTLALGTCATLLILGALAAADYTDAPLPPRNVVGRAAWVLDSGNRLHFTVHVFAGRVLDLTPWTRDAAERQYWRARFHARTPRERAVAMYTSPTTPPEWIDFMTAPLGVFGEWLGDAASLLRPVLQ